jgi:putative Holliday junction resolvase
MRDTELNLRVEAGATETGRVLSLDLGASKIGVAVCDEERITVRRLLTLPCTSWKNFVREIKQLCRDFDAKAVVVGLPLNMDGTSGDAAQSARRAACNLQLSLQRPVYLQDERLTSETAISELYDEGFTNSEAEQTVHTHSAAIILRDFLLSPATHRISALPSV